MRIVIVDPDKTSLTIELREWCEAREILVEEKFTSTNTGSTEIGELADEIEVRADKYRPGGVAQSVLYRWARQLRAMR